MWFSGIDSFSLQLYSMFCIIPVKLEILNQFLSERFGYNLNAQSKSMNTTMASITQLTERRVNEARQYVYVVIDSSAFG